MADNKKGFSLSDLSKKIGIAVNLLGLLITIIKDISNFLDKSNNSSLNTEKM